MNNHRIALYADTHYKLDPVPAYWMPPPDLDVEAIILAGDVHFRPQHLGRMLQAMRVTQRPETALVVVPGNGDYLDQELTEARAAARAAVTAVENAVFLDDEVVVLPSGLRIIGATLWSAITDDEAARYAAMLAEMGYTGVDNIRLGDRLMTFQDATKLHAVDRAFIETTLRGLSAAERRETIVCTHYWPTVRAVDRNNPNEVRFEHMVASDMDAFIAEYGPRFWLCGHLHTSKDITIGNTRLLSNPRAGESATTFNPDFNERFILEFADEADADLDHVVTSEMR